MTNEEIRRYFEEEAEDGFRKFTSGLILGSDLILGVRVPKIRALAKRIAKEDWRAYLAGARDDSYEEIMLQGLVIGYAKGEINEMLSWARGFLPKIHDWSVNDAFCSTFKTAQKHRPQVWDFLMEYKDSPREFEQRVVARKRHFVYRKLRIKFEISGAHLNGKALYVGFGSRISEESLCRLEVYGLLYAPVSAVHNERHGRG